MDDGGRQRWTDLAATLPEPRGRVRRDLVIADWRIRLVGLDEELAEALDGRWGAFCRPVGSMPDLTLTLVDAGPALWLDAPERGEPYRIEAHGRADQFRVLSYHFCLWPDDTAHWRVALTSNPEDEPIARLTENVVRYLTARLAIERGGLAFHAAGVLRDGVAHLFAGPSRAGKSTAVSLSEPGISLGDDMAIAVPVEGRWSTTALPFDNLERIEQAPPEGWLPLGGVWRLHQAAEHRVEEPQRMLASASLMACIAFPWALRDLSDRLLTQADRLLEAALYRHLHFAKDPGFWDAIG